MDEDAAEAEVPTDPLAAIQDAIAAYVDDGSMLVGFAIVAEWIEADGQETISIFGTPMSPWHQYGLLTYGRDTFTGQPLTMVAGDCDDDGDDDF